MEEIEHTSTMEGYIESLAKIRQHLTGAPALLKKLDKVIDLELDLAVMAAEKAMHKATKSDSKLERVK